MIPESKHTYTLLSHSAEETESWDTWTIIRSEGDSSEEVATFFDEKHAKLFLEAVRWYESFEATKCFRLKTESAPSQKPRTVKRKPVARKK